MKEIVFLNCKPVCCFRPNQYLKITDYNKKIAVPRHKLDGKRKYAFVGTNFERAVENYPIKSDRKLLTFNTEIYLGM